MWLEALQLVLPFLSSTFVSHDDSSLERPRMPPQFIGPVIASTPLFDSYGALEVDLPNKSLNLTLDSAWFGNYSLNTSVILLAHSGHNFINDRCAETNSTFFDPFSWLFLSKFGGEVTLGPQFHLRTCTWWNMSLPAQNFSVSLCMTTNNTVPVLLSTTMGSDTEWIYFTSNFSASQPPASDFVVPQTCFDKGVICDGGNVTDLDVYVFHPENKFDLINENVADLLGDTVFICVDANNTVDGYTWVSHYTLEVWSGWGEYALCNRPTPNETGVCVGKETYAVGREASYGIKEKGGQCVNNDAVGNWYSLPTNGLCNSTTQQLGPDPSKGDCSWRVKKRIKTIDGKCLLTTNHMNDICNKEMNYPFAHSRAILLQSFQSDDPSQGGCPPIA